MNKTKKITKTTSFTEILEQPELIKILLESGMHCIGCPMATAETIEQGAIAHGIDPDELIKKLNNKLKTHKNFEEAPSWEDTSKKP